ncbi:MAG: cysteine desulfurase family protein [Pirellulaceae bacterium]|nr:cysteine desulfurase family protein [Pirellulaceae bacterium]
MTKRSIYLDYNASTPPAGAVRQAITPFLSEMFAVPGNPHWLSRASEEAIEDARNNVSIMLDCMPSEIVFTSGGTESINLGLLGYARAVVKKPNSRSKPQMIISNIEHAAVARTAEYLETQGWEITRLACRSDGSIDLDELKLAIGKRTRLISIQLANEHIGTIQDIASMTRLARPKQAAFHTDATQAMGKIPVDVESLGVDLLSLSGHKMYAPKGGGALFVKNGTSIESILHGEWQEGGIRPGTENIPAIVGLGVAAQLVKSAGDDSAERLSMLSNSFVSQLEQVAEETFAVHGHPRNRLPNTVSIVMKDRSALALLRRVPELYLGLAIPHVIPSERSYQATPYHAIGVSIEVASATVRVSVGWNTTDQEIETAAQLLGEAYRQS